MKSRLDKVSLFKKSIKLFKSSWEILIFTMVIPLIMPFVFKYTELPKSFILTAIFFLYTLSINISLPAFIELKIKEKKLSLIKMLLITTDSARRIILPGLFLFFVTGIISSFIIFAVVKLQIKDVVAWMTSPLIFIPIIIIFLLFEFTSFYFSLEKQPLIKSMKMSLKSAFANWDYLILLIPARIFSYLITNRSQSLPTFYVVIADIISMSIVFAITCTTYLYFKTNVQSKL